MNKNIEISLIVHVFIAIIIGVLLNNYLNFNIFEKTYEVLDESKATVISDIGESIRLMRENPEAYDMTLSEINEYELYNNNLIDEAYYYMYYYMPSIYLLIILAFVILEICIFRRLKLSYMCNLYNKTKENSKDKLKAIIREKLNYKYRRIILPKHVPIMCMILYVVTIFMSIENELLVRAVYNMAFALTTIITIYGIRIAIKFFKTKSEVARILIIMANIFLGMMIPQLYFVIGFFKSLITFQIIIKTDM